jgi:hypothetical protein
VKRVILTSAALILVTLLGYALAMTVHHQLPTPHNDRQVDE